MLDGLLDLIDKGCVICVCACRTFDRKVLSINAVVNKFTPPFVVTFLKSEGPSLTENEGRMDQQDAERLLTEINRSLN